MVYCKWRHLLLFHGVYDLHPIMPGNLSFSEMTTDPDDSIITVVTCEGNLHDPHFPHRLQCLVKGLQRVLCAAERKAFCITKLEPWNSVRVTFQIPRDAAHRLRVLAQQGDRVLRDLGILSVQVEGDQVISLTIAGRYNEPQEIVLQTDGENRANSSTPSLDLSGSEGSPGPSNVETTRKNIAQYLSQQGSVSLPVGGPATVAATTASESSGGADFFLPSSLTNSNRGEFKSPNVVAPGSEPIPFPPRTHASLGSRAPGSFGPFPFASMTHAAINTMHGSQSHLQTTTATTAAVTSSMVTTAAATSTAGASPRFPFSSPPPYPGTSNPASVALNQLQQHPPTAVPAAGLQLGYGQPPTTTSNLNNLTRGLVGSSPLLERPNVALSSPLLVNLLQSDLTVTSSSSSSASNSLGASNNQHLNKLFPPPNQQQDLNAKRKRKPRRPKDRPSDAAGMIAALSPASSPMMSPLSPASTATTPGTPDGYSAHNPSPFTISLPAMPSIPVSPPVTHNPIGNHIISASQSATLTTAAATTTTTTSTSTTSSSPPPSVDTVSSQEKELSPWPSPSKRTQHLINPFTGQLEPMPSDDEDSADGFSSGNLNRFSSSENIFSDIDNKEKMETAESAKQDNESESNRTQSVADAGKTANRSEPLPSSSKEILPSRSPGEKIKLRLKIREGATKEKESRSMYMEKQMSEGTLSPATVQYKVDVSFVNIPSVKKATTTSNLGTTLSASSSAEPRVPPLHISLRGRNAMVVGSLRKDEKQHSKDTAEQESARGESPLSSVVSTRSQRSKGPRGCRSAEGKQSDPIAGSSGKRGLKADGVRRGRSGVGNSSVPATTKHVPSTTTLPVSLEPTLAATPSVVESIDGESVHSCLREKALLSGGGIVQNPVEPASSGVQVRSIEVSTVVSNTNSTPESKMECSVDAAEAAAAALPSESPVAKTNRAMHSPASSPSRTSFADTVKAAGDGMVTETVVEPKPASVQELPTGEVKDTCITSDTNVGSDVVMVEEKEEEKAVEQEAELVMAEKSAIVKDVKVELAVISTVTSDVTNNADASERESETKIVGEVEEKPCSDAAVEQQEQVRDEVVIKVEAVVAAVENPAASSSFEVVASVPDKDEATPASGSNSGTQETNLSTITTANSGNTFNQAVQDKVEDVIVAANVCEKLIEDEEPSRETRQSPIQPLILPSKEICISGIPSVLVEEPEAIVDKESSSTETVLVNVVKHEDLIPTTSASPEEETSSKFVNEFVDDSHPAKPLNDVVLSLKVETRLPQPDIGSSIFESPTSSFKVYSPVSNVKCYPKDIEVVSDDPAELCILENDISKDKGDCKEENWIESPINPVNIVGHFTVSAVADEMTDRLETMSSLSSSTSPSSTVDERNCSFPSVNHIEHDNEELCVSSSSKSLELENDIDHSAERFNCNREERVELNNWHDEDVRLRLNDSDHENAEKSVESGSMDVNRIIVSTSLNAPVASIVSVSMPTMMDVPSTDVEQSLTKISKISSIAPTANVAVPSLIPSSGDHLIVNHVSTLDRRLNDDVEMDEAEYGSTVSTSVRHITTSMQTTVVANKSLHRTFLVPGATYRTASDSSLQNVNTFTSTTECIANSDSPNHSTTEVHYGPEIARNHIGTSFEKEDRLSIKDSSSSTGSSPNEDSGIDSMDAMSEKQSENEMDQVKSKDDNHEKDSLQKSPEVFIDSMNEMEIAAAEQEQTVSTSDVSTDPSQPVDDGEKIELSAVANEDVPVESSKDADALETKAENTPNDGKVSSPSSPHDIQSSVNEAETLESLSAPEIEVDAENNQLSKDKESEDCENVPVQIADSSVNVSLPELDTMETEVVQQQESSSEHVDVTCPSPEDLQPSKTESPLSSGVESGGVNDTVDETLQLKSDENEPNDAKPEDAEGNVTATEDETKLEVTAEGSRMLIPETATYVVSIQQQRPLEIKCPLDIIGTTVESSIDHKAHISSLPNLIAPNSTSIINGTISPTFSVTKTLGTSIVQSTNSIIVPVANPSTVVTGNTSVAVSSYVSVPTFSRFKPAPIHQTQVGSVYTTSVVSTVSSSMSVPIKLVTIPTVIKPTILQTPESIISTSPTLTINASDKLLSLKAKVAPLTSSALVVSKSPLECVESAKLTIAKPVLPVVKSVLVANTSPSLRNANPHMGLGITATHSCPSPLVSYGSDDNEVHDAATSLNNSSESDMSNCTKVIVTSSCANAVFLESTKTSHITVATTSAPVSTMASSTSLIVSSTANTVIVSPSESFTANISQVHVSTSSTDASVDVVDINNCDIRLPAHQNDVGLTACSESVVSDLTSSSYAYNTMLPSSVVVNECSEQALSPLDSGSDDLGSSCDYVDDKLILSEGSVVTADHNYVYRVTCISEPNVEPKRKFSSDSSVDEDNRETEGFNNMGVSHVVYGETSQDGETEKCNVLDNEATTPQQFYILDSQLQLSLVRDKDETEEKESPTQDTVVDGHVENDATVSSNDKGEEKEELPGKGMNLLMIDVPDDDPEVRNEVESISRAETPDSHADSPSLKMDSPTEMYQGQLLDDDMSEGSIGSSSICLNNNNNPITYERKSKRKREDSGSGDSERGKDILLITDGEESKEGLTRSIDNIVYYTKPLKRRCSENAAELIKACMGVEDNPKRLHNVKQRSSLDESIGDKNRAVIDKPKNNEKVDHVNSVGIYKSSRKYRKDDIHRGRGIHQNRIGSGDSSDDEMTLSELANKSKTGKPLRLYSSSEEKNFTRNACNKLKHLREDDMSGFVHVTTREARSERSTSSNSRVNNRIRDTSRVHRDTPRRDLRKSSSSHVSGGNGTSEISNMHEEGAILKEEKTLRVSRSSERCRRSPLRGREKSPVRIGHGRTRGREHEHTSPSHHSREDDSQQNKRKTRSSGSSECHDSLPQKRRRCSRDHR